MKMCNISKTFLRDSPRSPTPRRLSPFTTHSALVRALQTLQMKTCYFSLEKCINMCNFNVDFFKNFLSGHSL